MILRIPKPRYSVRRRRWVANIGPRDKAGRSREVGAPRRIWRSDVAGAWAWMLEAIKDRPPKERAKIRAAMEAAPGTPAREIAPDRSVDRAAGHPR